MRDRDLVRLYWPVDLRPAFDALFGLDDAFAEVVASSTQPALGAIRLAWWREALERLDHSPPPPEPRLLAAYAELLSREVSGAMLGALEDGWAVSFDEEPDPERIAGRGTALFEIGAKLLGADDPLLGHAGRLFALVDSARRGWALTLTTAKTHCATLAGHRFSRKLRPLTALAKLAARDVKQSPFAEPEGTPGRAAALLSHRLFGTVA